MTNPQPNPHYEPEPERSPYVLFALALMLIVGLPFMYFIGSSIADQFECTGIYRLIVIWFWWAPIILIALLIFGVGWRRP